MELEELSKQQIVLLTMLVSFVTAIATGIVTVSLLKEAPVSVTSPVNHVVERTVERVVPAGRTRTKEVTKEKTVLVKQSEQISQAIDTGAKSVVRVYLDSQSSQESSSTSTEFITAGVAVTPRLVAVGDGVLTDDSKKYIGKLHDDTRISMTVSDQADLPGLTLLQPESDVSLPTIPPAQEDTLRPGTRVVGLGHEGERVVVADGIIAAAPNLQGLSATSSTSTSLETTLPAEYSQAGMPILNIFGELVAIKTKGSGQRRLLPIFQIADMLAEKPISGTSTAVVND